MDFAGLIADRHPSRAATLERLWPCRCPPRHPAMEEKKAARAGPTPRGGGGGGGGRASGLHCGRPGKPIVEDVFHGTRRVACVIAAVCR